MSERGRPLRVARVIARLNVGGPARHVLDVTRGLVPDVETTLLVGDVGPDETEAASWIASSGVVPERVAGLGRAVRPLDDLRALRELTTRFRELRPDVVHTHTAKAGALGRLAARRACVPLVVHTFHGHVFDGYFGPLATRAVVAAERRLARRTDAIVAVASEVADALVDEYRIAPRTRVHVVPPGIDLSPFRTLPPRDEARRALGLASDAPVLLWVGRLVAVKRPEVALGVARRIAGDVPGAVLLVAGDGPLGAALVQDAPPNVRFLGVRDDLPEVLAAADLALLTSRNEGTPIALVEAAAAGLPAVASRVGGVPSVVVDGVTGVLVGSDDPAAFATACAALLRDPARCARMGRAARRHAERYSLERLLDDLRRLYAGLADARA